MDEQLSMLIQLQEVDTVIRSLAVRKDRLPQILAGLEQRRVAHQQHLDAAKETLVTAQKNKRDREQDLEVGIQKADRLKNRTSEVKNNKEYQALLKEIEIAEQESKTIEDDILVLMEKIDAATLAISAAEQHSRAEDEAIAAEQKEHEAAVAKINEELKAAEQGKEELATHLEPSIFARYQLLLATKAGTAIVEVHGESCSGCFMSIPPQVFVNVKKNESIISCPQCNRILYYKEAIVQRNS